MIAKDGTFMIDVSDDGGVILGIKRRLFRRNIGMDPALARELASDLISAARESERRTGKHNGEEYEQPPFFGD